MSFVQESTDALRVNGFLAAFPDGAFGTEDLFYAAGAAKEGPNV